MAFCDAQNLTDGLRYSLEEPTGTARYTAMSGAFGALGGDFSALSINPAGGAVFLTNGGVLSLAILDRENNNTYFGTDTRSIDTDVNISQAGAIFVFDNTNNESDWKKFTIGVNYNLNRNLSNDLFFQGTGNNSIDGFFLQQAQGIPLDLLQLRPGESISDLYDFLGETEGTSAQNALLGYQGYIFDPVSDDGGNTQYTSNIASGLFNQEYSKLSEGYVGKYTLNIATQYTDDYYFGINLNSHIIDYSESKLLFEANNNDGSLVKSVVFENNLSVLGSGFSAQIGGIAKIGDQFRLGINYDTPTWYTISEETTQFLETERLVDNQVLTERINPRVLNIYKDYQLRTPAKIGASAAYVLSEKGLISFDYNYKNYAGITFGPDADAYFQEQNRIIENNLQGASSYRLGGEYRIDRLSLRGGLRYEESPYQDEELMSSLEGFSLGLGYNGGNFHFDVAYARAEQSQKQQLYSVGLTDSASIDTIYSNVVLTLGFSL